MFNGALGENVTAMVSSHYGAEIDLHTTIIWQQTSGSSTSTKMTTINKQLGQLRFTPTWQGETVGMSPKKDSGTIAKQEQLRKKLDDMGDVSSRFGAQSEAYTNCLELNWMIHS